MKSFYVKFQLWLNQKQLIVIFLLASCTFVSAQSLNFQFINRTTSVQIPCNFVQQYIIVSLRINDLIDAKFIVDTGAEQSLFTNELIPFALGKQAIRKLKVFGSDRSKPIDAALYSGIKLTVGNLIIGPCNFIALTDQYFQFESLIGTQVDGIIGMDLLGAFGLEINFTKKKLSLFHPNKKINTSKFESVEVNKYRGRIFVPVQTISSIGQLDTLNMLLDTGAGTTLIINEINYMPKEAQFQTINGHLGIGLGGYLIGKLGILNGLSVGKTYFSQVPISLKANSNYDRDSSIFKYDGLIGNVLLSYFEIRINHNATDIYLKAKKKGALVIPIDRSGMMVLASGKDLDEFTIAEVLEGSGADKAGIKPGDKILQLNGIPHWLLNLRSINKALCNTKRHKVVLKFKRKDLEKKITVNLNEIIQRKID